MISTFAHAGHQHPMTVELAALVACAILAGLVVFQLLLIVGLPIGRFAWGGAHRTLPAKLRIASVFSILLYALFGFVILSKAQLFGLKGGGVIDISAWIFTGYFFLGIFMNAISRSKPERLVMTPVALLLAGLFLFVALS